MQLWERGYQRIVFLQSYLEQHGRHLFCFPASKRWLGQGGWEGWSCPAMVAAWQCRKQSSKSASMLQQWESTLAASCLVPVLWALWLCCCYVEQEMKQQSWGGKSSRRRWRELIFPPLYGEAVFQFGKVQGNARDQCQRGPQLPISSCEVWQMFMLLTLRSLTTVLYFRCLQERDWIDETKHL